MSSSESVESDAFIDALTWELQSELSGGWRVDSEAVWLGTDRLLTLARYRVGFEACRWVDDGMRFVSSILRDELDRRAPMPKSYEHAVSTLAPRLRWRADVELRALAMDSLLGGRARTPVGFSVSEMIFAELSVESGGLRRRVSRRELEAWGSDQLAPAQRARQNIRARVENTWHETADRIWVADEEMHLHHLILPELVGGHPIGGAWATLTDEVGRLLACQIDDAHAVRQLLELETRKSELLPESFLMRPHADGLLDIFRAETLHDGCTGHVRKRLDLYKSHYTRGRTVLERLMKMRGGQGQMGSFEIDSARGISKTELDARQDAMLPRVDSVIIRHGDESRAVDWKKLRQITGGAALKAQGFSPEWFYLSSSALQKIHSLLPTG